MGITGKIFFLGAIFCTVASASGEEQAAPYYERPVFSPVVQYALHSGRLHVPFVLNQPYSCAELSTSIVHEDYAQSPAWYKKWIRLLAGDIGRMYQADSSTSGAGRYYAGVHPTLRLFRDEEKQWSQYRVEVEGIYTLPYLVLAHRTATDQQFKSDASYTGDTGEFIQGRVESGYALFKYRGVQLFAGRVVRNLGLAGESSLILSDHPYSYDHFGGSASSRRFRFTFYTTRLNDVRGYDSQAAAPQLLTAKRYWALQRFDFALRPNLHIGLSEAALYGGANQTFEAVYLNPMNLYYIAQRNHRIQMDGSWALDLYWQPLPQWTLYMQYLIDDVIVNNEPGQDDRGVHPDRMGVLAKMVLTDWPAPGHQLALRYARVGNWTYMSYRTWENYLSEGLSMGYPSNSFEGFELAWDYLAAYPFMFHYKGGLEQHGEQNMRDVFGDSRNKFPLGVVEKRAYAQLAVTWLPSLHYNASLNLRYNHLENAFHLENNQQSWFQISMELRLSANIGGWF